MHRQIGMGDARAEPPRGAAQARERGGEGVQQRPLIIGATVRQLRLRARPHAFVGVEFRGIRREVLEAQARLALEKGPDDRPAMDLAVVPEHHHRAAQVPQQMAEEVARIGGADVGAVEPEVESAPVPARTERQPGDHGHAVVALPVVEERRLPARRPRPPHRRDQEEARFVDEDEVGTQPRGVFFTRGQSRVFQRVMAASSRCNARRSGFCAVQPRRWRSRPT